MSESNKINKSEKKWSFGKLDYSYYIAFGLGFIILIISLIIVAKYRGSYTWFQAFLFPLLVYIIFRQILSGYGFITGYIPTAQSIINWLIKTSKKKEYSVNDSHKLDKKFKEIEKKEKKDLTKIESKHDELVIKHKELIEKKNSKQMMGKIDKDIKKLVEKIEENKKEKEKVETKYSKQKEEIKEKQKEYRGKITERIITVQEEMDPSRFKLIMLIPIFVIMAYGIVMAIIGLVNPIILWASGSVVVTRPALDNFDKVNEVYKGIMAIWGISQLYIRPAIKIYKDPSKEYIPKYIEQKRRIFFFFKRKEKDIRQILNKQFEDLNKHYWNIKQVISKALLIPIGLSILIVAPIGGLSIVLGTKTAILRKPKEKYELIIQIVIGVVLLLLAGISIFIYFQKFLANLHPIIPILNNLIYGTFIILSFRTFTRHPIIHQSKNKE